MDTDTLLFFNAQPRALPLYCAFEERLSALFPDVSKRVGKTQITFSCRYAFACVSFARVRKKRDLPDPWLVVTLGLPRVLASGRPAVQTEPYPGRWTMHIVISSPSDLDDELWSWVRQAYDFANTKGRKP